MNKRIFFTAALLIILIGGMTLHSWPNAFAIQNTTTQLQLLISSPTQDQDGDGVLDPNDDCPTVPGLINQNGCPFADKTMARLRIVDHQKSGICGFHSNGKPRETCEGPLSGMPVKIFDRENPAFITAYGKRPKRHLLDDIFEANIGLVGACTTNTLGECIAGEDHGGKFLVIGKFDESATTGKIVYTGKFKNFKDGDNGDEDDDEEDDDDNDGPTTPKTLLTKKLRIVKIIRKDGSVKYEAGFKTIVTGSRLEIIHPEYTVWQGKEELYPFIFSSEQSWSINICLSVPIGYQLVGVLDINEQILSTTECLQTGVSNETKIFVYRLLEVASPEPNLSFHFTASHNDEVTTKEVAIEGIRQWTEATSERAIDEKIENLKTELKKDEKQQKAIASVLEKLETVKPSQTGVGEGPAAVSVRTGAVLTISMIAITLTMMVMIALTAYEVGKRSAALKGKKR